MYINLMMELLRYLRCLSEISDIARLPDCQIVGKRNLFPRVGEKLDEYVTV